MRSNWKKKLDTNETNWNEQINLGYVMAHDTLDDRVTWILFPRQMVIDY
jgi:hypothetical protein